MDQHLEPGAVVMPQAASLHAMIVEFRVGHPGLCKTPDQREGGEAVFFSLLGPGDGPFFSASVAAGRTRGRLRCLKSSNLTCEMEMTVLSFYSCGLSE